MKHRAYGPAFSVQSFTVKVAGEHGCSVMSTLESAKAQADCYLESRPGGTVTIVYSEYCARCQCTGRIRKSRRTMSWKPCPVCKGEPETCPDTPIATYEAAMLPVGA